IESLVRPIGTQLDASSSELEFAKRAASLCKADLATQMVVEMTSLQGALGRLYYLKQGGSPAVADAIYEHYLPRFAGDDLPKSMPGLIVALADKLDSICGLFAVGLEPKGNADPFALRRAAIGIVQGLIINRAASFSLRAALSSVRDHLPVSMSDAAFSDALAFIAGRHRALLLEAGARHDVIEAVLAQQGEYPYQAQLYVGQLAEIVSRADWSAVFAAYSRCARIIRSSAEIASDGPSETIINDPEPASQELSLRLSAIARPTDV